VSRNILEIFTDTTNTVLSKLAQGEMGSFGGPDRDRTGGLIVANDALSQLSYRPIIDCGDNLKHFTSERDSHKSEHTSTRVEYAQPQEIALTKLCFRRLTNIIGRLHER
jgi:hypothetical protein